VLWCGLAAAGPSSTLEAFDRLEEILQVRIEEGIIVRDEVLPTLLVSTLPIYEESAPVMASRSLEVLLSSLGNRGVRMCEACMAPRTVVEDGNLVVQTGPIGLDEIIRLDDQSRGTARPARSAIWIDEHSRGVSIRIVDLATGRVLYAQNIDPDFAEVERTSKRYRLAAELERRSRGDGLVQTFFDAAIFPRQHISFDWSDQWGKDNGNLSGFTLSVADPIGGIGVNFHRRLPIADTLIGAKVLVSVPTVIFTIFDQGGGDFEFDPLFTLAGTARVPVPIGGRANFAVFFSASTSGQYGAGLTFMNPFR